MENHSNSDSESNENEEIIEDSDDSENESSESEEYLGPYVRLLIPNKDDPKSVTRLFIIGRSGSGKTYLGVRIVKDYLLDTIDAIFVICPTFYTQDTYKPLRKRVLRENVITRRPTDETFERIRKKILEYRKQDRAAKFLLLIDDVSADQSTNKGRKGAFASLSTEAPHLGLSIVCLFQQAKTCSAAYRNNSTDIVMFAPADQDALDCFRKEFNPYLYDRSKSEKFKKVVTKIWDKNKFVYIHRPARQSVQAFEEFDKLITIK